VADCALDYVCTGEAREWEDRSVLFGNVGIALILHGLACSCSFGLLLVASFRSISSFGGVSFFHFNYYKTLNLIDSKPFFNLEK